MNAKTAQTRITAPLNTPSSLGADAVRDISGALNALLADMFALYMKTKNFHWHVSGPHFRDYHLMLDEQSEQIFATPTISRNACANWAERHCDPSATLPACNG